MSLSSVRTRTLVALIALVATITAGVLLSPSALLGPVESAAADPVLFGLLVVGLYLVRPLFALPTTPLAAVVGYGYGVALGVPVALAGVVVTVVPVFLFVRRFAGDDGSGGTAPSTDEAVPKPARSPIGSSLERAVTVVGRYYETAGPLRGVVASRLAPIPSDAATCAAAVSGVRLRHLAIGTAIGELPWTIAAVVVGASAATVRTDGLGDGGVALSVVCLVAALALLAGPAYRAVRSRRGARPSTGPTDD